MVAARLSHAAWPPVHADSAKVHQPFWTEMCQSWQNRITGYFDVVQLVPLVCADNAGMGIIVQNPVTTMAWLVGDVSLLGPLVSLTIDTKDFCLGLFRTKAVLLFSLAQGIMVAFTILLRPHHHVIFMSAYLRLYSFAQSFRFEVAGLIVAGILAYAVMVNASRRLLDRLQRSRVHPA